MSSESTSPDDRGHVDDATVPPRPSPPGDVSTQETGDSTNASDSTTTPPVQEVPENGMTASTIRAINDDAPPVPVGQVADHEKETKGPQLHDGPPGPPRFSQEFDDSLAKKVEKERAAFPALEDRLRHNNMGSGERASQETRGSTNVSNSAVATMVQEDVVQGGNTASTICALNDDDPPIPVWHVVDHEKPEGNQANSVTNELEHNSSDHPRDNAPALHSTVGAPFANTADVDPQVVGVGTTASTNTTSPGAARRAATHSGATTTNAGIVTVVLQLPQARMVTPEDEDEPKPVTAEPVIVTSAILPFYRRKGIYVMFAIALLAVGIAVAMLLSGNVEASNIPTETANPTLQPTNDPTNNPTTSNKPTTSNMPTENPVLRPTNDPTNNPTTSNIPTKIPTLPPPTLRPTVYNFPTTSTYRAKLRAPDGEDGDNFGESVAIYGDAIVVGARSDDRSGSAYVFVRRGESWTQAKLSAPDGAGYDRFGESVAIYEDSIVVGAYVGSAHVFVRGGEEWTHQAKLLAPDGSSNFANSVAIYGDTIVVGASDEWAHVFVRSGEEWTHQAKLLAPDGARSYFGRSSAIYSNTIVVGARGDHENRGSAHVFVRSGEEWTNQAKLLAPDGAGGDWFGKSVAIYGDTIVVGAYGDDDNGAWSGSAHVFVRSGEEWIHQAKLLAPDGAAGDYFGWSVAIYGDTVVAGAPWDDDNGYRSGSAHVFVQGGDEWTHQAKLLAPDGAEDDEFGGSVAIYENTVFVGAVGDDNRRSARVFVV